MEVELGSSEEFGCHGSDFNWIYLAKSVVHLLRAVLHLNCQENKLNEVLRLWEGLEEHEEFLLEDP